MKKIVAITLAVVLLISMAACAKSSVADKASEAEEVVVNVQDKPTEEETVTANDESEYCGTWKMDHIVLDGVEYAASELETLDDYRSLALMVIKDGGKAYVAEGGTNGVIVDWSQTDDGILLDGEDVIMVDGLLRLEVYDDEIWYFQKESDSQLIDELSDTDDQEASENTQVQSNTTDAPSGNVEIKASPDKYTWYINNYVGKNVASIGYTSMGGDRMDSYGNGYIQLILRTPNGEYVNIHEEDDLKNWRVIGQSLEPNTEIRYTYQVDPDGVEYDNLILCQNIEEIVLAIAPVGGSTSVPEMTAINTAADRYTSYVREYVGRNLTQCGYTSMGGDRMDAYGSAYVQLSFVSTNGDYVDIQEDDTLKDWVVVAQNIAPNTELKVTYQLDEDGNEYDNLISYQNIEEIVLAVAPVGETVEAPALTAINVSPDRYTAYIRDYVGRTLASCGYVSMSGKLMDQYGSAYVHLAVYADDGSFVDVQDSSALKNYVVTGQSVTPNTELTMTYSVDSEGNEYDNLIDTQNIEEVELYVTSVNNYSNESEGTETSAASTEVPFTEPELVDGLRPEFKEAMDSYEEFFDEYVAFMKSYMEDPLSMMGEYASMMTQYAETMTALGALDDGTLSDEEALYYAEVTLRINQKLLEVAG